MTTLKNRIANLLPGYITCTSVTVKQLVARLNSSRSFPPVANATVRGRLSEMVAAGIVEKETRATGTTGFYAAR